MKKIFLMFILFTLFIWWCSKEYNIDNKENINYDTYKVVTWSISTSQGFIWYIEPVSQTVVSSKVWWRISQLLVDKSDKVSWWQLLWSIEWDESNVNYQSADWVLLNTNMVYTTTSSMFDAQIKTMEEKLLQAQNNIDMTKRTLEWLESWVQDTKKIMQSQLDTVSKQVEQSKLWIETIKSQIENTKNVLNQKEKDIFTNSKNAMSTAQTLSQNVLDNIDEILWVSDINRSKNDYFESYLSSKNSTLKISAESKYNKLRSSFDSIVLLSNPILSNQSFEEYIKDSQNKKKIYDTLIEYEKFLTSLRDLSLGMYKVLDASVASPSFTQEVINNYKKIFTDFQTNIDNTLLTAQWNYLLWIRWSLQSIENFQKDSKMQLEILDKQFSLSEKQYETSLETYNQYKAIGDWKINDTTTQRDVLKKQYELAQNQYNEAKSALESLKKQKEVQLSQINAQISQIQWNKKLAWVQISNKQIISPIDWVVVDKLANIGQVVGPWTPIFSVANDSQLKVKVFIPESYIKDIKNWSKANVYIKALWNTYEWIISNISPMTDSISKKLQIEIKILNSDNQIKIWMYSEVVLGNNQKDWIVIPYRFIQYSYWVWYVNILSWTSLQKVELKNIECKNEKCLVEWNLKVGDLIINK